MLVNILVALKYKKQTVIHTISYLVLRMRKVCVWCCLFTYVSYSIAKDVKVRYEGVMLVCTSIMYEIFEGFIKQRFVYTARF